MVMLEYLFYCQFYLYFLGYLKEEGGLEFDSSRLRKRPFMFKIGTGQVIKGWDEGVANMQKGEIALIKIEPDYGYGAEGIDGHIPGNVVLVYEVELLKFEKNK